MPGCDQEENSIHNDQNKDWEVKEDPMAGVLQEAFVSANVWFDRVWESDIAVHVRQEHPDGSQAAGAPSHDRVEQELPCLGVTAGNRRLLEHPAEVKTHDGHPEEHRHSGEISEVSQKDTEDIRKVIRIVDDEEIHRETRAGEDVTEKNFTVEIVEFWHGQVNKASDDEKHNADTAADGVDKSEGPAVLVQARTGGECDVLWLRCDVMTLHDYLLQFPLTCECVVNTEVVYKASVQLVE